MKVKSTKNIRTHALCFCDTCDFQEDDSSYADMQSLRNKIASHIRKTGHRVTVETGYTKTYLPTPTPTKEQS